MVSSSLSEMMHVRELLEAWHGGVSRLNRIYQHVVMVIHVLHLLLAWKHHGL